MDNSIQHHQSIQKLISQQHDFVVVIIIDMQGSAPQEPGAKMLVKIDSASSPHQGTIGGGKLELFAIEHAKTMLSNRSADKTQTMTLNLQTDIGMTCGGVVQLFFEVYQNNSWHIAVFGAGHVAQALIPLLLTLDCHVYCIDNRSEWLDKMVAHPALTVINDEDMGHVVNKLPADSFVVSVTRGHGEDVRIIQQIIANHTPPFIGVIGSDSKAVILRKELLALGVDPKVVNKIHCPIGLPLGKDTPAEIAVSISAQLIQVRDQINC